MGLMEGVPGLCMGGSGALLRFNYLLTYLHNVAIFHCSQAKEDVEGRQLDVTWQKKSLPSFSTCLSQSRASIDGLHIRLLVLILPMRNDFELKITILNSF